MHHCEGNGPEDLSRWGLIASLSNSDWRLHSTIRYQRDSVVDLCHYIGKFLLIGAFDLPWYFIKKSRYALAFETLFFESANIFFIYACAQVDFKATLFSLMIPLGLLRIGLMIGNWGQHALVDELEPESDLRSSITLIDVAVSCPVYLWSFSDGSLAEQSILLQWVSRTFCKHIAIWFLAAVIIPHIVGRGTLTLQHD